MDPNANLAEQDRIIQDLSATVDRVDQRRLNDLRHDLCKWIDCGGFQPEWNAHPQAAHYFALLYGFDVPSLIQE